MVFKVVSYPSKTKISAYFMKITHNSGPTKMGPKWGPEWARAHFEGKWGPIFGSGPARPIGPGPFAEAYVCSGLYLYNDHYFSNHPTLSIVIIYNIA